MSSPEMLQGNDLSHRVFAPEQFACAGFTQNHTIESLEHFFLIPPQQIQVKYFIEIRLCPTDIFCQNNLICWLIVQGSRVANIVYACCLKNFTPVIFYITYKKTGADCIIKSLTAGVDKSTA